MGVQVDKDPNKENKEGQLVYNLLNTIVSYQKSCLSIELDGFQDGKWSFDPSAENQMQEISATKARMLSLSLSVSPFLNLSLPFSISLSLSLFVSLTSS